MAVADEVKRRGWELLAPSHAECDLENADTMADYVLAHPADAVVNCAAVSGLESCADDPLRAHLTNAVAPAAMALACRHTGARFIHLSTDYVLDGRKPGFKGKMPTAARKAGTPRASGRASWRCWMPCPGPWWPVSPGYAATRTAPPWWSRCSPRPWRASPWPP